MKKEFVLSEQKAGELGYTAEACYAVIDRIFAEYGVHPKILERLLQLGLAEEDPTGTFLIPGNPEHCPGNGKHVDPNGEPIEICCDGCEAFYRCFPEWLPGGSAWDEDHFEE